MTRLIDADALKEGIKELKQSPWYNNDINPSWKQGIKDAVHVVETLCIDEEPTIDAVPVVRCKDCKYYRDGDCWHEWDNDGRIYYQSIIEEPNPDDYCSRAKRREE